MTQTIRDLTDLRFTSLTAISVVGSDRQGRKVWLCVCDCGKLTKVASRHLVQGRQKTCGCGIGLVRPKPHLGMKGPLHPKWKGGRVIVDGYVYLYIEERYVAEHRCVMEQHLQRELTADEVVHHRNEIRDDNRLSNLELMTRSQHAIHHGLGTIVR